MSLNSSQRKTGNSGMMYQYLPNQREVSISTCVIHGSLRLKSVKIFSNFGVMTTMRPGRIVAAADGEGLALLALARAFLLLVLLAGHLGDLGHEVAHLADFLLRFLFVDGIDGVLHLGPGGVHRFELEGRHVASLQLSVISCQ